MVMAGNCRRVALAALVCLAGLGSIARADWASCQRQPTRACLVEEAMRGDAGPLAGKERLDVLMRAGAAAQIEYLTAADIDEALRQGKPTPTEYGYASLAIRALVAANRKQEAVDLVATFRRPFLGAAFAELTSALAKVGDFDTASALAERIGPTLEASARYDVGDRRFIQAVWSAADVGKIEDALVMMMAFKAESPLYAERSVADMEMAIAAAYARRGDAKNAQRWFDLAGQNLEKVRRNNPAAAVSVRFAEIALSALRGDLEAVRSGLAQLPPAPADRLAASQHAQGYQLIVSSLLKAKQLALALEVAKSAPAAFRDQMLFAVNAEAAAEGRIDDARAVVALFSEQAAPRTRAAAVRNIAVATAKVGKIPEAIAMATQVGDATDRRAILFAIAQTLPR
jgi:hypothetical protein